MISELYSTIFFWIVWGFISAWVLRGFYFRHSREKMTRLRYTAIALELMILALFYFSWLPDGTTGIQLLLNRHFGTLATFILLGSAFISFLSERQLLLKFGVICHGIATVLFFGLMTRLVPQTVPLTSNLVAPIISAFLLLINVVVVLLLWQQLQLKSHRSK